MIGKTYIAFVGSDTLNVVGKPADLPIAAKIKIYASDGTAIMKIMYKVPSLSNSLSLLRAIIMPRGTPRTYAMITDKIPITNENPSFENAFLFNTTCV